MAKCFYAGIKGNRKAHDWQDIPNTIENRDKYLSKIVRHASKGYYSDPTKLNEQRKHLAAVACNANILWHMLGDTK